MAKRDTFHSLTREEWQREILSTASLEVKHLSAYQRDMVLCAIRRYMSSRGICTAVMENTKMYNTSIYAYNANWGASTKNRSKTNRKSVRNRPQNGPKSVPNRSKIGPRSASEPTSLPTSILDRLGTVFGPFRARSWLPLGGFSGV